jgi:GNAT superfamily N-acetyltransferase
MNVKIVNAQLENFEEIYRLFGQLWPQKELHKEDLFEVFQRGLQSDQDYYICAKENDSVIGFAAMTIMNNFWQEGYIAFVYAMIVEETFRGLGIGTLLIEKVCEIARSLQCKRLELDSAFHRERAHMFYEGLGFEKRAYLFSKNL